MKESMKILKKYLHVIVLIVIGIISNKDKLTDLFNIVSTALAPFFGGIFLAYLLNPLVNKLNDFFKVIKNNAVKNTLSLTITYILFIGALALIGWSCVPQIISNIKEILAQSNYYYDNILAFLKDRNISLSEDNFNILKNLTNKATSYITEMIPSILIWIKDIFKFGVNFIFAIILSIYLLIDKNHILNNMKKCGKAYLNEDTFNSVISICRDCEYIFNKFIIGNAIVSVFMGILCFLTMMMLNLDYAILISFLVGITNMIPYVGPFIGGAIGVILLLLVNPYDAFVFLIMIIIMQQIDGWIISPKILGGKIGIRPLWILLSVIIGGSVGGILGMFFGTPIVAIIAYLLDKDIQKRIEEKENSENIEQNIK